MPAVRSLNLFPWGCVPRFPPFGRLLNDQLEVEEKIFEVGPGTFFPFKMTLNHAVQTWWRVKHWKISFDYYFYRVLTTEAAGSFQETQLQAIEVTTKDNPPNPSTFLSPYLFSENETELACSGDFGDFETATVQLQWTKKVQRSFFITTTEPPATGTFEADLPISFFCSTQQQGFPPPYCFDQESSVLNNGKIAGNIVWSCFEMAVASHSSIEAEGAEPSSTAELKLGFLKKSYTAPMYRFPDENIQEEVTNLVMEPLEFWPYNPGDGLGPIYDKDTGAQLRPFPN